MPEASKPPQMEIRVSWSTLLKVFSACLLAYLSIRLWRLGELLLLALMIAVALRPLLQWTQRHGWPKWAGVALPQTSNTFPPAGGSARDRTPAHRPRAA